MEMSEVPLDELIYKMKQDKRFLDEKEKEREAKFKIATETYLNSINRENDTLKNQTSKINMRNDEFKSQIKNIYYKYFASSFKITRCEKKLIEERLRFNEYVYRISPHLNKELDEEKKHLTKELTKLKENKLPLTNPLEVFEKEKKRMDFKSVLQQNNHHHQYLENFQKKYENFRTNSEVNNIEDFSYQDKIKYGKSNERTIPLYNQEKIEKPPKELSYYEEKIEKIDRNTKDSNLNFNSENDNAYLNNSLPDYKPKTNVLSQFMTYSKNQDNSKFNDESLNFPFSAKKSNNKNKINDENSLLNADDDRLVENFDSDED